MKVKKILPCVCSVPVDLIDSTRNGMPIIAVNCGQYFSCYCPKCGRGSELSYFKSAYLALKDWNTVQRILYSVRGIDEENTEIDYDEKYGGPF